MCCCALDQKHEAFPSLKSSFCALFFKYFTVLRLESYQIIVFTSKPADTIYENRVTGLLLPRLVGLYVLMCDASVLMA